MREPVARPDALIVQDATLLRAVNVFDGLGPDAYVATYFRRGGLEEMLRLHAADTTAFYGDLLWSVLMLELWHRRHVRGDSAGVRS